MVEATKKGVADVVSWFKSLPSKAKSALGSLGGVLLNAGKSLISGFINGIKGMFGSVKSTLGGLTDKLTSWKGPAPLDKKILTPNGRMVIQGFQRGISKQTPVLRRQLQGLTSDLPGMAMDVSPKGVMSAAVRQAQTVTFDVSGADEDMKRLIRRIVKNDGRGDVQTAFGNR
jgi:phage-related protein